MALIIAAFFAVNLSIYASSETIIEFDVKREAYSRLVVDEELETTSLRNSFNQIRDLEFKEEENVVTCRITTYGVNCYGCYHKDGLGGTASGVKLTWNPSVRQSDGTWKTGITYDGYYVVATNSSIPLGSIIEVSNHGFSGYGLQKGKTFRAMVLDRGAMGTNHLDLFVGSEKGEGITIDRSYVPTMKVIRYGY